MKNVFRYLHWIFVIIIALSLGIVTIPVTTLGSTTELDELDFVPKNNTFITGETTTLNFLLENDNGDPYKGDGPFGAYITDPEGNVTYYTSDGSSVSNVTFDEAGDYILTVYDVTGDGKAQAAFKVLDVMASITGSLSLDYNSTVSVKLTDTDGNVLPRKSVSVDASNVGGNVSNYTTLYNGTFTFTMTATKMGTVSITHGGHIVGSIDVSPAYTTGSRIGDNTSDNSARSVLVSQTGWTNAKYAFLTRDDVVADAMVAVPMSKKYDAPILMTPTNQLNSSVISELKRLGVETVFIIGGEGAISGSVENQLKGYGFYPNRIAGADRYETAAKIAYWVGGSSGTVYLAYGYGEPDALAASALAAEQGIPILLTDTNALPDSTKNELSALAPQNLKLLGGTGVISAEQEQSLANSYGVERWGGVDRYGTQQKIFQSYFSQQQAANSFPAYFTSAYVSPGDVTSGTPYGDALFTAALAAKNNGFVIALPPNEIPSSISTFLLYNKVFIPSGTVVGNKSAISYQLETKLNQLLAR